MFKNIAFIFNESEIAAGTRGASLGPEALKIASWSKGSQLFSNYPHKKIEVDNMCLENPIHHPFAKRIEGVLSVFNTIAQTVSETIAKNTFPFVIAGDHSSAGGTIAGIKMAYPNERIGVIWIDAHGDLHTPYTTPSGNIHGMPVATALGEDNLPSKINAPANETVELWEKLKNVGGINPKINSQDLVFIAVRDTEKPENDVMDRLNITNFKVEQVNAQGTSSIVHQVLEKLSACDKLYISFDVDSMDPNVVSHGTGTPVDNGLMPTQSYELMKGIIESRKVCCLEFVEINPCLDEKKNKMAEVALELIEKLVVDIEKYA